MKTVILAGELGTRFSEETELRPKPMVEIGGRPILVHIMELYAAQGFEDFIVCLGYKGYVIKEYFQNYLLHQSDVTFDFQNGNRMTVHRSDLPRWKVTLVETGRIRRPAAVWRGSLRTSEASGSCSPTATASPMSISANSWRCMRGMASS